MNEDQITQGIKDRLKGESNLRWIRFIARMGQAELSLKTEIQQSRISFYENGLRLPSDNHRRRMAEALGVKPDDLIFKLKE